ncbi:hypothetical protein [Rivularia sp. UHCC 0363]|uniref:hypothetical protein n=1 Tax=Rivularia sp. UHCC 0363 TaxID=3110244 RepID=UPI002B20B7F9|nr:hypothetical protein [Rivularia sp. UHCC 0363]MEA5595256.1 hypothetical protein [Rivularia sp. UHCC 0363]
MVGKNLLKTFIPLMPLIARKIRITNAVLLLSTAVPIWLAIDAIAPQMVQAYTSRTDLEIDRLPGDNYQSLLRRAEAVARAAAQRGFDKDILVTDVSVIVSVQNYGSIAPVLELNVSRTEWRNRPDPQRWAKYFKVAQTLLYFGPSATKPNSTNPDTNPTNNVENNPVEGTPTPEPPAIPNSVEGTSPPELPDTVPVPTPVEVEQPN